MHECRLLSPSINYLIRVTWLQLESTVLLQATLSASGPTSCSLVASKIHATASNCSTQLGVF